MRPVLPPVLRPGDRIGVAAPAGPPRASALRRGIAVLEARGFRVVRGRHLRDRLAYLAGRDADRAADLRRQFADPDLAAIWFARGGYGSHRIVEALDFAVLRRHPKALIGYSDVTVLQAAALRHAGLVSFQGPMVAELGDPRAYRAGPLWRVLAGAPAEFRLSRPGVVRPGRAEGPLVGGCLSILVSLIGTPYEPPLDGAVLFWEEVNEEPFRIDRMLAHLRLAGRLSRLRGMVVGRVLRRRPVRRGQGRPLRDLLGDHLAGTRFPVVTGLPLGHGPGNQVVPIGGRATLDTAAGRLTVRWR